MINMRQQVVSGFTPPEVGESLSRELWPSVLAVPALAALGEKLTRTIVLAPLAWLMMAPIYFKKVLPFVGRRYTLTNRRVMIRTVFKGKVIQEVALSDIDDVRIAEGSSNRFFQAATLEIWSHGQVVMKLPGTPGPESFRRAILEACKAWAPIVTSH